MESVLNLARQYLTVKTASAGEITSKAAKGGLAALGAAGLGAGTYVGGGKLWEHLTTPKKKEDDDTISIKELKALSKNMKSAAEKVAAAKISEMMQKIAIADAVARKLYQSIIAGVANDGSEMAGKTIAAQLQKFMKMVPVGSDLYTDAAQRLGKLTASNTGAKTMVNELNTRAMSSAARQGAEAGAQAGQRVGQQAAEQAADATKSVQRTVQKQPAPQVTTQQAANAAKRVGVTPQAPTPDRYGGLAGKGQLPSRNQAQQLANEQLKKKKPNLFNTQPGFGNQGFGTYNPTTGRFN